MSAHLTDRSSLTTESALTGAAELQLRRELSNADQRFGNARYAEEDPRLGSPVRGMLIAAIPAAGLWALIGLGVSVL